MNSRSKKGGFALALGIFVLVASCAAKDKDPQYRTISPAEMKRVDSFARISIIPSLGDDLQSVSRKMRFWKYDSLRVVTYEDRPTDTTLLFINAVFPGTNVTGIQNAQKRNGKVQAIWWVKSYHTLGTKLYPLSHKETDSITYVNLVRAAETNFGPPTDSTDAFNMVALYWRGTEERYIVGSFHDSSWGCEMVSERRKK